MKINLTPEKLAANRANAQKSTGPKTDTGRAASKMNALKHGILAESVVVGGPFPPESPEEFEDLCRDYYASLTPEGPLEQTLVDQIITATWRLRRVRTAESGEIALNLQTSDRERTSVSSLRLILEEADSPFNEPLLLRLRATVTGCQYLVSCLESVRADFVEACLLTTEILEKFNRSLRHQSGELGRDLKKFLAWTEQNPEHLRLEDLYIRSGQQILEYLDRKIRAEQDCREECLERDVDEAVARKRAAALPSDAVVNKVLRYETALERQLYRAVNQLERLQRNHPRETAPVSLNADVAPQDQPPSNSENYETNPN